MRFCPGGFQNRSRNVKLPMDLMDMLVPRKNVYPIVKIFVVRRMNSVPLELSHEFREQKYEC
jgi:hypothetical protein